MKATIHSQATASLMGLLDQLIARKVVEREGISCISDLPNSKPHPGEDDNLTLNTTNSLLCSDLSFFSPNKRRRKKSRLQRFFDLAKTAGKRDQLPLATD